MTRRFLAVGDSYTIGEGVNASESWPMQLAALLRNDGVPFAEPRIVARTGWTTAELLAAIDSISPPLGNEFDLVSLLIGVNDQYRGLGAVVFRDGFLKLLSRASQFARDEARRVVILSIPDWGVTPFAATDPRGAKAIADEIDQFNAVIREEARKAGARFVDITPISRRASTDAGLLASDGLHPSATMYADWVAVIAPVVLEVQRWGGL